MKNEVWFVVLTYNPILKKLLTYLHSFEDVHHVVVDNSEEYNNFDLKTQIIRTFDNLGYAGGMNIGIDYCLKQFAQWIVVTNDDLDIDKKSVSNIVTQLKKIPEGVAGPFTGGLDPVRWSSVYPQKQYPKYISGSFMAIHRNVITKIGNFYEPYFIYYEDVELSIRLVKEGFRLTRLDLNRVFHQDSTTMKKMNFLREYYLARNHLLFVERNAPMSVRVHELLRLPKTYYEHISKKEFGAAAGVRDYMLRRFGKRKGTE